MTAVSLLRSLALTALAATSYSWAAELPGEPEANGLLPRTDTIYINTPDTTNNGRTESLGVAIANNGNVMVGWEDDGSGLTDLEAVWTLFNPAGELIIPETTISTAQGGDSIVSRFLSFFRADGSPTPGSQAWGPKIKANLYGEGLGLGATAFGLGLEIPELADVNIQASNGNAGDFPAVQLVNNDGTPSAKALSGYSDTDADPAGDVRIGDWEYLSDGNIVIVGESRQQADLVERFGGVANANHAAFRILKPDGTEVKSLTLASEEAVGVGMWHGVGTVKGGFGIRFEKGGRAKVRLFANDGTPTSGDIDLGTLSGIEALAGGGRGDSAGFHGNGNDAYVAACTTGGKPYVMVINADGTLRWARAAAEDLPEATSDRVDAGITADGRVLLSYADKSSTAGAFSLIVGRVFSNKGEPVGNSFLVSEKENPSTSTFESRHPRVAVRGNSAAIAWESRSVPDVANRVVATRFFNFAISGVESAGLVAKSSTTYVNTPDTTNNGRTESLGVAIAKNGNVVVGWEDDGSGLTDLEAVWTLYSPSGAQLIPETTISSAQGGDPITSRFLSFFRADGSPTPGSQAWGPKIKANQFGDGFGMGATAFGLGLEIPELADVNIQASNGNAGDFPAVQLVNNDGTPAAKALAGYSDTDADPAGDVRIGDWEYLSDGNVVIVGESRQQADLVERFGGAANANHAAFRVLKADGTEVKSLTLASSDAVGVGMWHGAGVVEGAFGLRFEKGGRGQVRIFNNDGTPITSDIDLGTLAGADVYAGGGRGDSAGFHGNGKDAFVVAHSFGGKPYVIVLNANGTLRWARPVADDYESITADRVDAAIAPDGRVVVVFADKSSAGTFALVVGRMFDAQGNASSPVFLVSELETPSLAQFESRHPRVAWRDQVIAVAWESRSVAETPNRVVALRVLEVPVVGPTSTIIGTALVGGKLVLTWDGGGTLESATSVTGPWEAVANATSPAQITTEGAQKFYRVR